MPGHRERQRDAPERRERARAEIARGLDVALVDAVEGRVERQDEERDVAVDERDHDGRRLPVEPAAVLRQQPELLEQRLDAEVVQEPRAPAVGREQVDPRQHAHQVVDPERQDEQQQHERAPAAGVARRVVRDGVADQQRERHRERDVRHGAHEDREERAALPDVAQRLDQVADVPVERVPERHGLVERVLVAEGNAEHRVHGDQEEDREPHDAGSGEHAPDPAGLH